VVSYRTHVLHRDPAGRLVAPNRLIVTVPRVEVASTMPTESSAELAPCWATYDDVSCFPVLVFLTWWGW